MSARKFPRDVPRSVQAAVRAALELIDAAGEVVGGMPALQEALGHDSASATRAVVSAAEALGYMRRVGPVGHGERRVFVVVARLKSGALCQTPACAGQVTQFSRSGRCKACASALRLDRAWGVRAVEMFVAKESPATIATLLKQPLFPEADTCGVLAHLVAEGFDVGEEWMQALRDHSPAVVADIAHRRRVRRHRRRESAA